jgi:hypothetical protein
MGGACNTCRGEERCLRDFGEKTLGQTDQLEDLGLDDSKIFIWIFKEFDDLAKDRDTWQAVVNAVMNLQVL